MISKNRFVDTNIFTLVDQIVKQLKIDLDIPQKYLNTAIDLPVQSITTENVQALSLYIRASVQLDYDQYKESIPLLIEAVDIDKLFLQAQRELADMKMSYLLDPSWKEHWNIILKYM